MLLDASHFVLLLLPRGCRSWTSVLAPLGASHCVLHDLYACAVGCLSLCAVLWLQELDRLLRRLKSTGHRCLIFTQVRVRVRACGRG